MYAYFYEFKTMRHRTTERSLFGQREIAVWATEPRLVHFEKADVKVRVKIVEFDYGTSEDHVLVEIATNGPECPGIQRGINIFKQNTMTIPILNHMKMSKRDIKRLLTPHRSTDAILYDLTKTLQTFIYGV